jgi:Histidine kinase-, DNA gyrase B-, and HSP90-like ATPase
VEPATIVGAAAADLAHLLAELIENALVFSPPDQNVDIRGRIRQGRGDGAAEGGASYTLAVIDSGLGMSPAEIEAANRRLAGEESFTIAPSKYLGHYVAGNLAARHGIGVRLDASPGNGITATVNIPPPLLTTEPTIGAPPLSAEGDGARPVPAGAPGPSESGALAAVAGMSARGEAPGAADAPWRTGESQPPATSSWPAPAGLAAGTPPPAAAVGRTSSGLVKRARTNGAAPPDTGPEPGSPQAGAAPGSDPRGDLLAALSRHSARLQGIPGMPGQPSHGAPAAAPGPQAIPPVPPPPPPAPTGWPTPGAYEPTGRHDRVGEDAGRRGPQAGAEPTGPASPASSGPPLTRRVRGAQMPNANPLSLHRTTGEHQVGPGTPDAPPVTPGRAVPSADPHRGERPRSADDVYSFLTSFTAGVRKGLDDAQSRDRDGEDNGSR